MSFGWVDFSDDGSVSDFFKDKNPQETSDPLKIAYITKHYANKFYPEIKTQLTRAKYYVAVPYALMELEKMVEEQPDKYASENAIKDELKRIEYRQRDTLCKNSPNESFPGSRGKGGSFRVPSGDYWASLKNLEILDPKLKKHSRDSFLKNLPELLKTTEKRWNVADLYEQYKQNGPDNLKINLTEKEKEYISGRFKEKYADSPFAKILEKAKASEKDKNEIVKNLTSVNTDKFLVVKDIYGEIAGNGRYIEDFNVASAFSVFAYVLKIVYEVRILDNYAGNKEWAEKLWNDIELDRLNEIAKDLDVDKLPDNKKFNTKRFLSKAKELLLKNGEDKNSIKNIIFEELDKLICSHIDKDIKHNIEETDKWKGQEKPDFYSGTAVRILLDLIDG